MLDSLLAFIIQPKFGTGGGEMNHSRDYFEEVFK